MRMYEMIAPAAGIVLWRFDSVHLHQNRPTP
nr:MAG TPA: hypothetical protein [Caudoviricetes sp.]